MKFVHVVLGFGTTVLLWALITFGVQIFYPCRDLISYQRNYFIIMNVSGICLFLGSFWLLLKTRIPAISVPMGAILAGILMILSGNGYGWGGVGDRLQFFVGLIVAVVLMGGGAGLVVRYAKKQNGRSSRRAD